MNPRTQHTHIAGPVGQLQIQIDEADAGVPFKGTAITAHPNPVQGGTMHGIFPSPVLGGVDDGDRNKNGRHVPTTSTDQVGATVMQWMGLDRSSFHDVFPNLANFSNKTIPLLRV